MPESGLFSEQVTPKQNKYDDVGQYKVKKQIDYYKPLMMANSKIQIHDTLVAYPEV